MDVNPGDRQADCLGLMEPSEMSLKNGEQSILHRCVKCGHTKKNNTSKDDSFDGIVELSGGAVFPPS